jgi:nitroreductase
MKAIECIRGRRSIREYTDQDISNETLRQIIETASYAPSWKNTQTVSYIAIKNQDVKNSIAQNGVLGFTPNMHRVTECNTLIAVITRKGICGYNTDGTPTTSKGAHWQSFDAGIATQTLCLAAYTQNVGSVILGIYDEKRVAEILGINLDTSEVAALVALGYTNANPQAPKRKPVDELLTVIE